ncbi:MAG: hypothetical protein M1828_001340 [Chrysothrix sp. TS-e1954]|nr:MAG: hypothetical protein M1828_001340 [Chrysothrix sp. TS-e1954]
MPFRSRMKRAFGHSSFPSSSTTASSVAEPTLDYRKDPTVYKPGEYMPRPKYRAPAEKEHTARLESFSFGAATDKFIRRLSGASNYSPMGTKLPSRNTSVKSKGSASRRASRNVSRNGSFQADTKFAGTMVRPVTEGRDELGDVGNVGLTSRRASLIPKKAKKVDTERAILGSDEPDIGTAHDHKPFTEADVSHALRMVDSKV